MNHPAAPRPADLPTAFIDALTQLLGERFTRAAAVLAQHGQDEGPLPPMPPDAVAFVRTTQEVSQILGLCHVHRVPVVPFGNGSSIEGQIHAVRGGVSLDFSQMDQVLEVHPEDFTARVQAGVSRKALNAHLNGSGLFFPIDPGADASLGGMCATRASGTNAVRYGTMRENVLALTVVLADGTIVQTGTRAKKSSAGYDLTHLFVGSEGTLGVITEVTVRLHPQPEAVLAASCAFERIADAVDTVVGIIQYGLPISRVEFIDALAVHAINRYSKLTLPEKPTLFFEFAGTPLGVREQVELVEQLVADNGGAGFAWAEQQEDRARLWHARHSAYFAAQQLRPGSLAISTDVCVPISRLAECVEATIEDLQESGLVAPIVGHVGDGNFHVLMLVDGDRAEEMALADAVNARIVRRAIAMQGTCTGEHGIGLHKKQFLVEEAGAAALQTMRTLKRALDPLDLLNPGKIFELH